MGRRYRKKNDGKVTLPVCSSAAKGPRGGRVRRKRNKIVGGALPENISGTAVTDCVVYGNLRKIVRGFGQT